MRKEFVSLADIKNAKWVPISKLAEWFPHLSMLTIQQYASRGALPLTVYKIGGRLFVKETDLKNLEENNKV